MFHTDGIARPNTPQTPPSTLRPQDPPPSLIGGTAQPHRNRGPAFSLPTISLNRLQKNPPSAVPNHVEKSPRRQNHQSCFPGGGTPQHVQAHGGSSGQAGDLLGRAVVGEVAAEEVGEAGGVRGVRGGSEGGDREDMRGGGDGGSEAAGGGGVCEQDEGCGSGQGHETEGRVGDAEGVV